METALLTALISTGTSVATIIAIKPFVDKKLLVFQLRQNFRAEQTKKIKDVFAIYKNGLLKSGELLNNRLKNYSKNYSKKWHHTNGDFVTDRHYMDTMVYRFLAFFAHIQLLEKKLIYLDTTISDKSDLRTIKYFRLFHDIMCDVDLFSGLQYDHNYSTDHFFTTPFENMSNSLIQNDSVINLDTFLSLKPAILPKIDKIYTYFDGIDPVEIRLRCERLKIFHLALVSFLNEFGYDYQKTSSRRLKELKTALGEYRLLSNYKVIIEKYRLSKWFGELESVIKSVE